MSDAARDMEKLQAKQVEKTFEYDKALYKYQWGDSALWRRGIVEGGPDKLDPMEYLRDQYPDREGYTDAWRQNLLDEVRYAGPAEPQHGMQAGEAWRKYQQALNVRDIQITNAENAKAFQDRAAREAWEYGKARERFEHGVATDTRNLQIANRDIQLAENILAKETAEDSARLVRDEQILQQNYNLEHLLQEFIEEKGTFGFDKEKLLFDLDLQESEIDQTQAESDADILLAEELNTKAQSREREELNIRKRELNTKVAMNQADLDAAIDQAASAKDITERTGELGVESLKTQKSIAELKQTQLAGDEEAGIKGDAELAGEGVLINYQKKTGDITAARSALAQDYMVKEAATDFNRAALGIEVAEAKERRDYQTDAILNELQNKEAKAKFGATQAHLEALTKAGQAQVSQAGRSAAKNAQMFMAAVGRQQAEMVSEIIYSKREGREKVRQNKIGALNDIQRAAIKNQQINLSKLENLNKLSIGIDQANRDQTQASGIKELDMTKLAKSVTDAKDLTNLTVQDLQREIGGRQGLTIAKLEQIEDQLSAKREAAHITWEGIEDTRAGAQTLSDNRIATLVKEIEGKTSLYDIQTEGREETKALLKTGTNIQERRIDKAIENLTTTKGINERVIASMKASAHAQYAQATDDIARSKQQADITARARVMIEPKPLDQMPVAPEPQPLPVVEWADAPDRPMLPPMPLEGAKLTNEGLQAMDYALAAGQGALAGFTAYAGLKAATATSAFAPYVGLAIGIGTFLNSVL